ncbi:protease inhibitor I42 family protein [Desulfoferrobacter suflitae]|uniref:protease inhibitor I42 family protein n=1 Tax=Desulfoferrobacter suflitae TaxID=2865782 RepID=UPI0021641052|nr:protease inhibitor I42 family protein [Desulfoferrobacter suflitae]MCK8600813.1 protease inhibitor I42 family protein [Desulfoferrobacter suflitae]
MRRPHKLAAFFCILVNLFILAGWAAGAQETKPKQAVGPASVWQPGAEAMDSIRGECADFTGQVFEECFIAAMATYGASVEAAAFARGSGNLAYVRNFQESGRVDIAYVEYPFRANENQGILLVNGFPQLIDVDNFNVLPRGELQKDPLYVHLVREFPNISVWPGDRSSDQDISAEALAGGGQRFILNYRLLDGCHACELLGQAKFAFRFDGLGNFTGTKLVGVESLVEETQVNRADDSHQQHLIVDEGEQFSVSLDSNPTTGYHWELAEPLDERVVRLIGDVYQGPETKLVGAGGKEVWTFRAVGTGEATIAMKYVRPWQKDVPPEKTAQFAVTVR